jgi:hypothetical protein
MVSRIQFEAYGPFFSGYRFLRHGCYGFCWIVFPAITSSPTGMALPVIGEEL